MSDHPLSAGQKALWFLGRLAPESAAYNLAIALRIPLRVRSPLDTEALARSLAALSDRHPALRTTFPVVDGEPRQRVHPRLDPGFTVRAVDDLETPLAVEAQRPFDLEAGP